MTHKERGKKRSRKEVNKKFILKNEYKLSWNYIKESKHFIFASALLFLLFALYGFFVPTPEPIVEKLMEILKDLIEQTKDLDNFGLISFILLNNLKSSFFGMIFGFFLGIFPIISLLANGYLVGFVGRLSVNTEGLSILLNLVPHGIFELPALFISLGLGIRFGTFIFQKNKLKTFQEYFWNSLRVFFLIIIPLLILAAVIEGTLISLSG
jgi:stage II sporulation protein M